MLKSRKSVRVGVVVATFAAASLQVALAGMSSPVRTQRLERPGSSQPPLRLVRRVIRTRSFEMVETLSGGGTCVMRVLPSHPVFDLPCSQTANSDSSSSPTAPGSLDPAHMAD